MSDTRPMQFRQTDNSDARLSVVERAVVDLGDSIRGVAKQVEMIRGDIAASGKTNWGLVISIIGVAFVITPTIGGLIWFGVGSRLDAIIARQSHVDSILDERTAYLRELAEAKGRDEERARWVEKLIPISKGDSK